jgi:hypothetical protein
LTWVSEGKDFRRLRVAVKAGEVVEVAMLAHGSLLSVWRGALLSRGRTSRQGARGHHLVTNGWFLPLRHDQPTAGHRAESMPRRFSTLWRRSRGGRMTVSRDAAGPYGVGRNTLSALCVVGLLTTLGACAAENAAGLATSASAPAAAPAAAPVAAAAPPAAPATPPATAATTTAAAPKPAPQVLTPTEINEQCWMSSEVNKMKDLDAKAKYVDKCVAEKMKAQGM